MNILANFFRAVVVDGAVRTLAFIRRNPAVALLILLIFIVAPLVMNTYAAARKLVYTFAKIGRWFSGLNDDGSEVALPGKIVRAVVLVAVWILVPGSFVLWSLGKISLWIAREKSYAENTITTTPERLD